MVLSAAIAGVSPLVAAVLQAALHSATAATGVVSGGDRPMKTGITLGDMERQGMRML
jgi:hypothetical protein